MQPASAFHDKAEEKESTGYTEHVAPHLQKNNDKCLCYSVGINGLGSELESIVGLCIGTGTDSLCLHINGATIPGLRVLSDAAAQ